MIYFVAALNAIKKMRCCTLRNCSLALGIEIGCRKDIKKGGGGFAVVF